MRDHPDLYRALIDACPDAVFFLDLDGVVRFANPAAAQMYGYTVAELQCLNIKALDHPTNTPGIADLFRRFHCGETLRCESVQRRKDGTALAVEVHAAPVSVADKILLAAFARDITDKKCQEQRSKLLRSEFEQVSHRTTMSELVTGIRHELNQPLAALRLYVDSATELAAPYNSSPLNECLRRITEKLQHSGELIHDKVAACSPLTTRRDWVDIHVLIKEVLEYFASDLKSCEITITLDFGEESCLLFFDRNRLQQVLVHLVRNAVEALSAGDHNDRQLRICTVSFPEQIRVRVSDSGPGLDPTIAARLFAPFHTTKPTGLGLGLAISRNLIEGQGGEIGLESSSAQGTTFYFVLPRADARASG